MRLTDYISQNRYSRHNRKYNKTGLTCSIIHNHHEKLKNDPQRLTTELIQNIIGVDCNENNNQFYICSYRNVSI
jgi:hypothetical protein